MNDLLNVVSEFQFYDISLKRGPFLGTPAMIWIKINCVLVYMCVFVFTNIHILFFFFEREYY